jgi:hypothetical protein
VCDHVSRIVLGSSSLTRHLGCYGARKLSCERKDCVLHTVEKFTRKYFKKLKLLKSATSQPWYARFYLVIWRCMDFVITFHLCACTTNITHKHIPVTDVINKESRAELT